MGNITQAPKLGEPPRGMDEESKVEYNYKILEERLRDVEGFNIFYVDALNMSLVPDVMIPPKSKVPDFEKHKGINCPMNHLRMFVERWLPTPMMKSS